MGRALLNLFEFCRAYKTKRCKEGDLKSGDIVACFDVTTVCCLGKVIHVGHTELTDDHEDGPYGEVFVLPYYKARVNGGRPYNSQTGWWLYKELTLLPKQEENFSKGEVAKAVIYVGHKPTTRREQIQKNWVIEVDDKSESDEEDNEEDQVQGSPRRSPRKSRIVSAPASALQTKAKSKTKSKAKAKSKSKPSQVKSKAK